MTTKVIQPANASITAHATDCHTHAYLGDGLYSIMVHSGVYEPPEGWEITTVQQLASVSLVDVQREGDDE